MAENEDNFTPDFEVWEFEVGDEPETVDPIKAPPRPLEYWVEKINGAGLKDVPSWVGSAFADYGQDRPEIAFDGKTRATALALVQQMVADTSQLMPQVAVGDD